MKKQKEKMPLKKRIILVFVTLALGVIVGILFAAILSTPTDAPESNSTVEEKTVSEQQKVLFEDDNYKVTYQKFVDPDMGVTTFNLYLKVENKSDKEVTVMLNEGYANDTAVTFMTGMPVNIAPGKNAIAPFIFGYANLGFEKIEDIKKLEFKVSFRDKETFNELFQTDTIQLDF